MIIPLVSDTTWREHLRDIPSWAPPAARTIIISPHPDDETLGAGGLIQSLATDGEVVIVAVTDGEGAYGEEAGLGPIRCQEQVDALQALGLREDHIVRLGLPDRRVTDSIEQLVDHIRPLVDSNCHLVAPWTGDFHPDHEACGRAAERVAEATGARLSFYFFWTWHRGTPEVIRDLPLKGLPLNRTKIERKGEAIRKHRSQLFHPSGEPILPQNLLAPTLWPFEVYATL